MDFTVDGEVLCDEPAVIIFAGFDARRARHVLPPILALIWLHLPTRRQLEISIRHLPVAIVVKVVEKLVEFFLICLDAPVCEIVFEVITENTPTAAHIQSHESTAHRLPLEVNLGNNLFYQVIVVCLTAVAQVFLRVLHLEPFHVSVELRVDSL